MPIRYIFTCNGFCHLGAHRYNGSAVRKLKFEAQPVRLHSHGAIDFLSRCHGSGDGFFWVDAVKVNHGITIEVGLIEPSEMTWDCNPATHMLQQELRA